MTHQTDPVANLGRFERLAFRYYERLPRQPLVTEGFADDRALMRDRVRLMREVERKAVTKAALAGVLSGAATAVATLLADPLLGAGDGVTMEARVAYWSIVGGTTVVASLLEVAFLYWDALVATRRLNDLAAIKPHYDAQRDLTLALIRAALELPNSAHPVFGVNPMREASRLKMLVWGLLYKLKVGLTSFVLKTVVKRLFGRSVARGAIEFFAIPVLAFWNALVCMWYMREARLRACGPFYAEQLDRFLFPDGYAALDATTRLFVLKGMAAMIVANQDLHPNILLIMRTLYDQRGDVDVSDLDDTQAFLGGVGALPEESRAIVLDVMMIAAALNGKLAPAEKKLLYAAQDACGAPRDLARVQEFCDHINDGTIPERRASPKADPRAA